MAIKMPLFLENLPDYSATDMRRLLTTLLPNPGCIGDSDLVVSQHAGGANMSVDVAAGSAVVAGTAAAEQGNYLFTSDAVVNVAIAAAPASGHSRIDLIVALIEDQDQDGGANNQGVIEAVTGASATTGSQVAPSPPASSLVLAPVLVGPLVTTIVTSNITDQRSFAGAAGSTPTAKIWMTSSTPITSDPDSVTTLTADWTSVYLKGGFVLSGHALVVPEGQDGIYTVKGWAMFSLDPSVTAADSGDGDTLEVGVNVNGSGVDGGPFGSLPITSGAIHGDAVVPFDSDIELSAGDELTVAVGQGTGTTIDVSPVFLSATLITRT